MIQCYHDGTFFENRPAWDLLDEEILDLSIDVMHKTSSIVLVVDSSLSVVATFFLLFQLVCCMPLQQGFCILALTNLRTRSFSVCQNNFPVSLTGILLLYNPIILIYNFKIVMDRKLQAILELSLVVISMLKYYLSQVFLHIAR